MLSDIQEENGKHGLENCFGSIPSLPELVGCQFLKRQDALTPSDLLSTPTASFGESSSVTNVRILSDPNLVETSRGESIRRSLSNQALDSISDMLDSSGVPSDEFILVHPRELYNPMEGQLSARDVQSWQRPAKRPKPLYPTIEARGNPELASQHQIVEGSEERKPPAIVNSSEDQIVRPVASSEHHTSVSNSNSNRQEASETAFEMKSHLFAPIHDSDDEYCEELASIATSARSSSSSDPARIPKFKLKPRSKRRNESPEQVCGSQCGYV